MGCPQVAPNQFCEAYSEALGTYTQDVRSVHSESDILKEGGLPITGAAVVVFPSSNYSHMRVA